MPQFTIDLPETIIPALTRKAPEGFLASYVVLCLESDEQRSTDPARDALEDLLDERDKGPFITITDMNAYREEIRAKVTERIQQLRHA